MSQELVLIVQDNEKNRKLVRETRGVLARNTPALQKWRGRKYGRLAQTRWTHGKRSWTKTDNKLMAAADSAFAMLAGTQLDVFTPLRNGPMTAEQIAAAIGVAPTRLRLLLYCLVASELLTEKDGVFSNSPEVNQFLVKGDPA